MSIPDEIYFRKGAKAIGKWRIAKLQERLVQKHSRAVFIKAKITGKGREQSFYYNELIYCEGPSIEGFVKLAKDRKIVLELMMYETDKNKVRNRGYAWRLSKQDNISDLFMVRAKLR